MGFAEKLKVGIGWRVKKIIRFIKKGFRRIKKLIKLVFKKTKEGYFRLSGVFRGRGICLLANSKRLKSYKDKHQGERCFLVGNGPSLTSSDLDLIKDETTIGCNMVYKIFDQTEWRPTYHCLIDVMFAKNLSEEIADNVEAPFFVNLTAYHYMKKRPKDSTYVYNVAKEPYKISNNFLSYYVPSGATVMSFMIELAIYMGFKEIYLIGVDCTSSLAKDSHFIKDYLSDDMKQMDVKRIENRLKAQDLTKEEVSEYYRQKAIFAYNKLNDFANERDVKIYNATRGGALESFERVNLSNILGGVNA